MNSRYPEDFFLTYFTSAEVIRRGLNLNDVSRKVLPDDAIPLSVDTYAYNGFVQLDGWGGQVSHGPGKVLGPTGVFLLFLLRTTIIPTLS